MVQGGWLDVDGARIRWRRHGRPGRATLILVHGGAAHQWWWQGVIAHLTDRITVATLDLSGHGESEWRAAYTPAQWAREVAAVAEEMTPSNATPPVVVGHSMGGRVGVEAAHLFPHAATGLIVVETQLRRPDSPTAPPLSPFARRPPRVYATRREIEAAFRVVPAQPLAEETRREVARRSVRRTGDGWTWTYDMNTFGRFSDDQLALSLRGGNWPIALVLGGKSAFPPAETAEFVRDVRGADPPVRVVRAGYHHLPLDHPRETAAAIAALARKLAQRSPPRGRAMHD
jgi:pimeloyl-ACP methyl ester carboxylesterase